MLSSVLQQRAGSNKVTPPSTSVEEWLERQHLSLGNWPLDLPGREKEEAELVDKLGLTPFTQTETIESDLAAHANFDFSLFEQLERRVTSLTERATVLGAHVYDLEPKLASELRTQESDPFLTADDSDSSSESSEDTEERERMFSKSKSDRKGLRPREGKKTTRHLRNPRGIRGGEKSDKRAEDAIFMGFDSEDLTPLPGQIDPLKVLDFVSQSQDFSAAYMRCWKKMFYCEASSAILQDLFWLLWLGKFNIEADIEEDTQSNFLLRLSLSYVKLFQRIPIKFRDLFFLKYSDCLSQSLYVAFWALFPGSRLEFADNFRRFISTLVHKTLIGLDPPPLSWDEWRTDPSKFSQNVLPSRDSQSSLHKLAPILKTPSPDRMERDKGRDGPVTPDLSPQELPAHPFGLSPIFHNVKFNILGRSPLISCYMRSIGVTRDRGSAYINRSEILAIPNTSFTYKQMMEQIKKDTEAREAELRNVFKRVDLDVSKNWRECRKEMNQLRKAASNIKPYNRFLKRIPD